MTVNQEVTDTLWYTLGHQLPPSNKAGHFDTSHLTVYITGEVFK